MNVAKIALRAASTCRVATKHSACPHPLTSVLRSYATGPPSNSPSSPHEGGGEFDDIDIPDRVHPIASDLMRPDTLLDLAETQTFEPSRRTKFRNTVTIRNDPNMFEVLQDELGIDGKEEGAEEDDLYFNVPLTEQLSRNKLYVALLFSRIVTQQTGKGKMSRKQVLTVVGNQKGLVGFGYGKHEEHIDAWRIAVKAALRTMDYVERFEDRTIWTEMEHKFGATRILMRPRPVGFGLRCNPNLYHILKAAGIKDISAKVWGSRNQMQVINCAAQMLMPGAEPLGMGNGIGGPGKRPDKRIGMRSRDEIERQLGRKLVPMRYP